jgi:putative MATE family efflux protein
VGTVALISHAVGRKDQAEANRVFNQSLLISAVCGVLTLVLGYSLLDAYINTVGADAPTRAAGQTYLRWFLPGLALQFAVTSMAAALRGTGIVRPTMSVQVITVLLNIVLAPMLIAGWGTGRPLGVLGAALASTIAVVVGVILLALYFIKLEKYVSFEPALLRPDLQRCRQLLNIGLPAGGEFLLLFTVVAVIYWVIRDFGAATQAGFGIGARVMQSIFLPAMAVAFATTPIAGQNFGARRPDRVRDTFRSAAIIGTSIMIALTLLCHLNPQLLIRPFSSDPRVIDAGAVYLRVVSWNFVAVGLVFTCSAFFQALGNTWPSLLSSAMRLLTFVLPAIWISLHPPFELVQIWHLSVASVAVQAVTSLWLLRGQFRTRLQFA